MEAGTIIGIAISILVWIGTLVYWTAKTDTKNKHFEETLKEIKESIAKLASEDKIMYEFANQIVKERTEFNETHFVSKEGHDNCRAETIRRLDIIESMRIGEKLAEIQVTQTSQSVTMAQIQVTLEQLRRDISHTQKEN